MGPPDIVVYNARKNFVSIEFKQLTNSMAIKIKEVLVEAYNNIGRRRVPKAGRWITGFSLSEFSPHMYIRSSPRGPSRDPYRTLSKE